MSSIPLSFLSIVLSIILDFGVNTVFDTSIASSRFTLTILTMSQMVTILAQFFSWFIMLSNARTVKIGGYYRMIQYFWVLFVTTLFYVVAFAIYKILLFTAVGKGIPTSEIWNDTGVVFFWSLERLLGVIHYAFSLYYMFKIITFPSQFM